MKKIDLGQAANTLANVGVLVGIVFLVIEIDQNTTMIESQTSQSRTESAMFGAEAIYNSPYLPDIFQAVDQEEPLTYSQTIRLEHWLRSFSRNQDNYFGQYRAGLLDEDILRSIRNAVEGEIAPHEITRAWWGRTKVAYSEEYAELVDEIIREYLSSNQAN